MSASSLGPAYQVDGAAPTAAALSTAGTNQTALTAAEQTISLTTLTAGAHTIYVVVKDAVGNVNNLLTITIPTYVPPIYTSGSGGSSFSSLRIVNNIITITQLDGTRDIFFSTEKLS